MLHKESRYAYSETEMSKGTLEVGINSFLSIPLISNIYPYLSLFFLLIVCRLRTSASSPVAAVFFFGGGSWTTLKPTAVRPAESRGSPSPCRSVSQHLPHLVGSTLGSDGFSSGYGDFSVPRPLLTPSPGGQSDRIFFQTIG